MSLYYFKATDSKGKLQIGEVTATSERDAETIVRDKGLKVLVVSLKGKEKLNFAIGRNFPNTEKIAMCRYFGLMINAGIPLGEGFELMVNGTDNKVVRRVLQDISSSVRQGKTLHFAFSKYPQYFNEMFLTMVKTGETSGSLASSFSYLASQLQQEQRLKQKVLGSLLYPVIIVALMGVIGLIVFAFVLPNLAKVFSKMSLDIPIYTRVLFAASLFMQKNLIPISLALIFSTFGFVLFVKSKTGREIFYRILNNLPITKKIILEYNLVRFNQSLSALLSAGVPITESVELAIKTLSFVKTKELIETFNKKLIRGVPLSGVFAEVKMFPKVMTQMIAVGERTGNLDKTLSELSSFYQEEVENSLKNFTTVLEPVLMIIVGVGVGVMVISIISPIYGLIGKLQSSTGGK